MGTFKSSSGIVLFALLNLTLTGFTAFALECESCRRLVTQLSEQAQQREQTVALLDKNKRYLASVGADEASKFLKVNSNVVMILKKLDAIKAQTVRTQETIAAGGCDKCKDQSTNTSEVQGTSHE